MSEVVATQWTVMKNIFLLACFALLAIYGATALQAQTTSATLSGTVMDPTGRVVPDVVVVATDIDTNVSTTTKTNGEGIYVLTTLQPGHYRVIVTKQGFKQIALTDVVLNVQDTVSRNFNLDVGAVSETVTVEAGGLNINTTDAAVSTVIDRQFAENLPLNGRSFQALIDLTPGVVLSPVNANDGGQFNVNGQRASSNYWMVDGVSANIGISATSSPGNGSSGGLGSFNVLGGTNSLVSVDALQEFRIQTSSFAPEFGRTPGGQISIITRSGTNQFHGTVFDYLRNDVLDANNWFADSKGLPKPQERQNDFGGTFGGRILKDRTFFFFSYEGLRLRLPQTTLTTVPCGGTCQAFGNARTMASPPVQPFMNAFPMPNGPEVFTPCTPNVNGCPASGQRPIGAAQLNTSYSNPAALDAYSLRIDHKLNRALTLFGRYEYSPSEFTQRGFSSEPLSDVLVSRTTVQTGTAGTTWIISPLITNDFRFNYSRTDASSGSHLDNFGGAVSSIVPPFPDSLTTKNALLDFFILTLQHGSLQVGPQSHNLLRQINVVDNIAMQKGSHSLKFGVDYRRLSPQFAPSLYLQEPIFSSVAQAAGGNVAGTFLTSRVTSTLVFHNLGAFAQDNWRLARHLTLTYGLRWDVDFAPSSLDGPKLPAVTGFNLSNLANLALAPSGTPPFNTTYGNVGPRLGLAYQVVESNQWQTVLRGGFGVFYDLATSEVGNLFSFNYPFGAQAFLSGGSFPPAAAPAPPPITVAQLSSGLLSAIDPNLDLPYTLQWNVAVEQGLGGQQSLSVSYVGATGRRLIQTAIVGAPNPNFGTAKLVLNGGTSDYHAMQVQFQRRLARGLQALASYTWAHSIDTGSAGSVGLLSNAFVPGASDANRGPSDFDIRNAFSAAATYQIPVPSSNALAKALVRGWSVENVVQARSAPPVDILDFSFFGTPFNSGLTAGIRPDIVTGQPFYLFGPQFPGGKALNPAAFTHPPSDPTTGNPVRQGNLPRNALRAFGATQWDFAVHREFPIRESLKLQFRAEMFNVLNHPNFGTGIQFNRFGAGGFGVSSETLAQTLSGGVSGGFNPLYQIGGPRSIQLALKLSF